MTYPASGSFDLFLFSEQELTGTLPMYINPGAKPTGSMQFTVKGPNFASSWPGQEYHDWEDIDYVTWDLWPPVSTGVIDSSIDFHMSGARIIDYSGSLPMYIPVVATGYASGFLNLYEATEEQYTGQIPLYVKTDAVPTGTLNFYVKGDNTYESGVYQPGASDGLDTYIDAGNPTTNYGSSTTMKVSEKPSSNEFRSLMRFDLSTAGAGVPADATIDSCTIELYVDSESLPPTGATATFYRVKRNWVEGATTWNMYSAVLNWQTAGAAGANDIDTSMTTLVTITDSTGWKSYDITKLARDAQNNRSQDLNILLRLDSATQVVTFRTSDYGSEDFGPKLTINYTRPLLGLADGDITFYTLGGRNIPYTSNIPMYVEVSDTGTLTSNIPLHTVADTITTSSLELFVGNTYLSNQMRMFVTGYWTVFGGLSISQTNAGTTTSTLASKSAGGRLTSSSTNQTTTYTKASETGNPVWWDTPYGPEVYNEVLDSRYWVLSSSSRPGAIPQTGSIPITLFSNEVGKSLNLHTWGPKPIANAIYFHMIGDESIVSGSMDLHTQCTSGDAAGSIKLVTLGHYA